MATPAFPRPFSMDTREALDDSPAFPAHVGITIQDYFAARAMQSMLNGSTSYENIAEHAYKMANAMIEARAEA